MASNLGRGPIEVGEVGSEVTHVDGSGNLYQAGTLISASAAELNLTDGLTATTDEINRVADKSTTVVNAAAATLAVTAALHGNRIVTLNRAAGVTATLPAASGSGIKYTFIIGTTATSNANIIKVANATDVMDGSLNIQQDTDADGTSKVWMAEVGDDTMTFAGAATTGGIVGNRIECIDYAAGFWSCTAWTISGGGSEATPFSATVA